MHTLYGLLILLGISLPVIGSVLYAVKRRRSARAAAPIVIPYGVLLCLLLFLLGGLRGIRLLGWTVIAVAVMTLTFYSYANLTDFVVGQGKKKRVS